jgi:hypothetical protein
MVSGRAREIEALAKFGIHVEKGSKERGRYRQCG